MIAGQIAEAGGRYAATAGTVVIKTPSLPLAIWAPETAGEWTLRLDDTDGIAFEHHTGERLTGFALAGRYVREASAYEKRLAP